MKKKIVITGVTGLVGLNLLTELDFSKYDVVAIDRNAHNIALARKIFPKARFIVSDVTKKGFWQQEFKDAYCVIELQAQIASPEKKPYYDNNVDSVKMILETDIAVGEKTSEGERMTALGSFNILQWQKFYQNGGEVYL